MKFWYLVLVLLASGFSGYAQFSETANWELRKSKGDMEVFVREAPDSPFKELKLKFEVESSMAAILALLQDIEAIPEWVYKCSESYLVKKVNENEEYYYNKMDFPWPMSDRDFIVKNKITYDKQTDTYRSESWIASDIMPEKEDIIRIKSMHIWWEFVPKSNNTVEIDYYLKSDPGGYLPAWLVNMAIDQGPAQTIKRFRKILKEPKYANATMAEFSDLFKE